MPTGDPEAGKGGQQSGMGGYGGDEGNLGDAQEGQASPSGPTGSPSGGHPDNDPSTGLSYGSNQTEADLNFQDLDAVENAMRSVAISVDDVDYSAYDDPSKTSVPSKVSPNRTENKQKNRGLMRGLGLQTQEDIDNAAQLDKNRVEAYNAFHDALNVNPSPNVDDDTINAPQNPMETAQFDMDALNAHLQSGNTFGLGLDALSKPAISQVDGFSTFDDERGLSYDPRTAPSPTFGALLDAGPNVEAPGFEADVESFDAKNAAKNISLNPAQQKQLDRAIAYEAAIKGKTGMLDAFRDLMGKLEETETKTYFGFEFEVAKLSKHAKHNALVAFRDKYGKQIEAYNKHYSKQEKTYREKPGLINPAATIAGLFNPILGMVVRAGQAYGYKESDVEKALTAAEIDAGVKEADHGEDITKEACEAMGYRWDGGLQACFKSDGTIHQGNWGAGENAVSSGGATADSAEVYNPYVGMV